MGNHGVKNCFTDQDGEEEHKGESRNKVAHIPQNYAPSIQNHI